MGVSCRVLSLALSLALALPVPAQEDDGYGFRPSGTNIRDLSVPEIETRHPWLHGVDLAIDRAEVITPDGFETWFRENAEFSEDSELVPVQAPLEISDGLELICLRHRYLGMTVLGEEVVLMVRDGRVISAFARIKPRFTFDLDADVGEAAAVEAASSALLEHAGEWIPDGVAPEIQAPTCERVVGRRSYSEVVRSELQYACKAQTGIAHWWIVVHAQTREVLRVDNTMREAWIPANATGNTVFAPGFVMFPAEKDSATTQHRMVAPGVETLDAQGSDDVDAAVAVLSNSSNFGPGFEAAVTAHFTSVEAIAAINNRLGIDFLGLVQAFTTFDRVQNVVNWGKPVTGFFPERSLIAYGFQPTNPSIPRIDLDVVGHEFGHALADYSLPPNPTGAGDTQYASIHEGFADIIGEVVELDILGTPHNWITGETLPGSPFRHHSDPSLSLPPQPDVYGVPPWQIPGSPNYDEHVNGSILARWMTLLVDGCAGCTNSAMTTYTVQEIGLPSALTILYASLQAMPFLSTYPGARTLSNVTIRNLCGEFSQERRSMHNAWYAVGLNSVQVTGDEHLVPADGASGVPPWPAALKWQAGQFALETDWVLEISKDAAFPSNNDTITGGSSVLGTDGAYQVGEHEQVLEPDTLYYWRIKKTGAAPDLDCWRPTRSFTTNDQIPTPWYPTGGQVVHPWVIDFAWSEVPGATEYEIQISEDSNFPADDNDHSTLIFPPQIIPAQPAEPDQTARITVPKNKDLFWRVRAHLKAGPEVQVAEWSQVEGFATNEPTVVPQEPADGVHVYPWPILFQWELLPGATFNFGAQSVNGGHHPPTADPSEDHWLYWYQNADGMWNASNVGFEWWVTAKGPPLGSELTPLGEETREDAVPSPVWTVYIDGDPTEIQISVSPQKTCYTYGDSVTASWPAIPEATHYEVQLHLHPHPDIQNNQLSYVTEPDWDDWYSDLDVRAMHEDRPGVAWTGLDLEVRPAKPVITYVAPSASVVPVTWTTQYAGGTSFSLEAYEELNCGGSLKYSGNHSISPDDQPGTVFSGHFNLPSKKRPKSFRVRSFDSGGACTPPWSDCAPFSHAQPEPPPDPNAPTVQCGETIIAGANTPVTHILDFGQPSSGQIKLKYDHYCVPDISMVRMPGGTTIASSGCTGTGSYGFQGDVNAVGCQHAQDEKPWTAFSNASYLVIKVIPNCLAFQNTLWEVEVECQLDQ